LDICWHYTSTGRGLISGASPTTRISRYSPARTIHNAPPTSRFDKLPAHPYASQIDVIARDSTNGSLEHYLDASGTTAFLVIHDDELLYEKYFDGYDKNSIQTSLWMAKSFVSALVGIAIYEGHIKSVDEPITNYIFELREKDKRFGSNTIRNLLTMSSGRTGCVA
jgi:CubicO group peptidase (beta-lactamase class C family)